MQYFVVLPDGQKFGPADAQTLSAWAAEGRLSRDSMVEDASTGQRIQAGSVSDIVWPMTAPPEPTPMTPPGPMDVPQNPYQNASSNYYRDPPQPAMGWAERQMLQTHMAFLVLGLLCCALPMTILSTVAFFTAVTPNGKQRSQIFMIIGILYTLLGFGARIMLRTMVD
ncbi:MAG: hypothetical protein JNM85_03450 [Chthonomonas sp.]|nr:hypothetical protein [Chthonomonas sp.]